MELRYYNLISREKSRNEILFWKSIISCRNFGNSARDFEGKNQLLETYISSFFMLIVML